MPEVAPFGEVNNISKTDVQIALHKKEYTELEYVEMLMLMPKIVAAQRAHYNKTQEKIIKVNLIFLAFHMFIDFPRIPFFP